MPRGMGRGNGARGRGGQSITYYVLMGIHEHVETIRSGYSQYVESMLDPGFVIDPRAGRLNGLPCEDIPERVVSIPPESREVLMCIGKRKRPRMELNGVALEKVVGDVGGLVGGAGVLGITCAIYSPENDLSAVGIAELAVFNRQPKVGG